MNDGGAAFPITSDGMTHGTWAGMTLRDYFAAKALPYCLGEFGGNADDKTQFAQAAYQIADAMLAAREVTK